MRDTRVALEALVASRSAALLRTAFLLTGDEEAAKELLQGALERVVGRLHAVRDPQALESYVRSVMATRAATDRRRLWRRERPWAQPPEIATDDLASAADTRVAVIEALRRLPAGQRAVLVLRYYEDLTEAQTAALLGISLGTVKSRTARALAAMRESGTRQLLQDGVSDD